jgi:hypothetical protein
MNLLQSEYPSITFEPMFTTGGGMSPQDLKRRRLTKIADLIGPSSNHTDEQALETFRLSLAVVTNLFGFKPENPGRSIVKGCYWVPGPRGDRSLAVQLHTAKDGVPVVYSVSVDFGQAFGGLVLFQAEPDEMDEIFPGVVSLELMAFALQTLTGRVATQFFYRLSADGLGLTVA